MEKSPEVGASNAKVLLTKIFCRSGVRSPQRLTWESLANLHLKENVTLDKDIDNLVAFIQGHDRSRASTHLAIVFLPRPLGPPQDIVSGIPKPVLASGLRAQLVERIMTRAYINANGDN